MTVETQVAKVIGLGNGVTTVFSFSPIVIFATSDLVVTKTDANGVETTLSEGASSTTYSVAASTTFPGTGSVTYPAVGGTPLATGETITMKRVLTIEQATNLENQGGYFPDTQETQFDKLVMIDLQQQELLDRSFKVPVSDTSGSTLTTAMMGATAASKYWRNSSDGLSVEFVALTTTEAAASDVAPIDVSLSSASAGSNGDFSREDHRHLLPTVTVAKGGTGATSAPAALTALAAAGTGIANTFTKTQTWTKGSDVASASSLSLGDGNYFDITGTTTVTAIATKAVGTTVKLHFDGALQLTHNGSSFVIPGAANFTTSAGDEFEFTEFSAGNWRCTGYALASGESIAASGKIQQIVIDESSTASSGTTTTPFDNTIPQNTEGNEFQTVTITPSDAGSTILLRHSAPYSASTNGFLTVAMFKDSDADAIKAVPAFPESNGAENVTIEHSISAGSTSAQTFKIRAGLSAAGTTFFNRTSGTAALYGGIPISSFVAIEILP